MFTSEIEIRIRYGETDQMGYAYYGNYASYFEVARVEALREIGISYKRLEENGFMLPVFEYKVKYLKPAFYDDVITVKTIIKELPGARIRFEYETYNEKKELINVGETTLVFIKKETNKPCIAPTELMEKMKKHFTD
jgi:acyl-CoA thioester hydrolase